ncbi:Carbonic anhydrases/acetyltransferases isoleucine patch superfamily-like protein [Rubrobacter xylanophilus DSM 9941]|uniref:Carbonic anhydrases/acetyltransferases isoleucine patch superfamily-like protein n=1 Tax=Rubrobacter xylanophilus (strain DSM 9941 / JCM 11954 / NBRC 16129 / PRD-1) TaxID=266117 RepID=Q1AV68_RUBXD|nr:gamma carbonic anhydrase family protein [Rubrobacter xylanophilus]ABG04710.1 Carbonic anhydrases/acetyltransferases isoleucine patch superfamily-like protein [Rubrobacter xylanophilus DSM 9941]
MAHLYPFEGKEPRVAPGAFVAPTAVLIGDVVVEEEASVWFGAVLRADFNRIVIGRGSAVQDNCVIHTAEDRPTLVGAGATVGHMAMLEGCTVEEGALVGMGAVVLRRARVGARAMLAAGTVVREGQEIPAGVLAAGVPARVKKELGGSSGDWVEGAAREYRALRLRYMRELGALAGEPGKGGM